jgi:hypothetical protein
LGVKSFVYSPGVASTPARLKKALSRWPPFIIVWLAAFVWLPTLWVSIALVSWLAWIMMDIQSAWGRMDFQEEIKPSR